MRTFEAGRDVTLPVNLFYNGQPAVPDAGTAVLSVADPGGAVIYTEDLVTGPTDVVILVTIPAEHNQISTSFARRIVRISAARSGVPFDSITAYRLVPTILYTVQPKDVRSFLGVNESELPDEDVDLSGALLNLEFSVSRTTLAAALTSGEEAELRANEAILYRTVLDIIPSLANRVAMEETDGALSFRRNARKDFSELKAAAESRLSAAMAVISPTIDPGYAILITTADADPITGA
ncbi:MULTISPECIES: hypothetical protein [unclassified Mesorhizobium]|uniref:hypothetical protein n=1 Tax=unclassified Mesorhizobium TaxID=325217 RepID=UPI00112E74FA|nr:MULTISPECIES: hypothetical protein [unclassified Mesorhizobium]TPL42612.1 hypothetical protein FJ961_07950 [Mesorhizobium sp. B2-4-5]TPL66615.1 hypothetical protein FJ949_09630 [Mesorhizobium sp. B2-4-1]